GAGRRSQRLDHALLLFARDRDLDPHLRQEVHDVLGAAIDLGVAFLAAVTFDLGYRHAADAEAVERLADVVELERLDDRDDELHDRPHPLRLAGHNALRPPKSRDTIAAISQPAPGDAYCPNYRLSRAVGIVLRLHTVRGFFRVAGAVPAPGLPARPTPPGCRRA